MNAPAVSIEQVAGYLDPESVVPDWLPDGKRQGSEWVARNPTRGDKTPGSFKVNLHSGAWSDFATDDRGGDLVSLWAYLQGQSQGEAARDLAARYAIGGPANGEQPRKAKPTQQSRWVSCKAPADLPPPSCLSVRQSDGWTQVSVVAAWPYRDTSGALLGYACRVEPEPGKKDVIPVCWMESRATGEAKWKQGALPVPRTLYGAELLAAAPEANVVLVEGEKAADAARRLLAGVPVLVLTWPGGCKAVEKAHWELLAGRKIVGWPDCDAQRYAENHPKAGEFKPYAEQPGMAAMLRIAEILEQHGTSMRVVAVPEPAADEWASGYDLADLEADGWSCEQVMQYLRDHLRTPAEIRASLLADPLKDFDGITRGADEPDPVALLEPLPVEAYEGMAGAESGIASPALESPQIVAQAPRFAFLSVSDMVATLRPIDWLVRGYIERDALAVVYGEPGHGKSFLAIDMACSIATGTAWHGHPVKSGAVFYIAGEGHNGLARRFRAWSEHSGVSLHGAPLFASATAAALTNATAAANVAQAVRLLAESAGHAPALIVVDTLARNFGPADENSSADMGAFVSSLDLQLRHPWQATVIVVHHSGKDASRGARGSSALRGAVDAEYEVARDETGLIRLTPHKMKDAEPPEPLAFTLEGVRLPLTDDEGAPVFGAALRVAAYVEPPRAGKTGRGKNQTRALQVLADLYAEHRGRLVEGGRASSTARVSINDWRDRLERDGIDRRRFSELRVGLEKSGLIRVEVGGYVHLHGDDSEVSQ